MAGAGPRAENLRRGGLRPLHRSPYLTALPSGWITKVLGVKTETETVDAALDAIALRKELSRALRRARAAGGLKDIYKD